METRNKSKHLGRRLVWHKKEVEDVMHLLANTKSVKEVELIFDRVLTTREINDVARRYRVLKMLDEGKSYADIAMATGMSSSVICRLSSKCGYGFQKTSGLEKPKNRKINTGKTHLKYKGVRIR